jgi:hypothetical protein
MSLIKLNNNSLTNLTEFTGTASLGDMVLVSSATASSSASIEFTLGDYKEYKFFFVNMHPQNTNYHFQFNLSTDNGSNYNVSKTSTAFRAMNYESDAYSTLAYTTSMDLANGTGEQMFIENLKNDNDASMSGYLHLFNPSSNTFVKHYMARVNMLHNYDISIEHNIAGYANTTSPLTNIKFVMSNGNIDDGKILMFGLN